MAFSGSFDSAGHCVKPKACERGCKPLEDERKMRPQGVATPRTPESCQELLAPPPWRC
jgi:hypothetical protein